MWINISSYHFRITWLKDGVKRACLKKAEIKWRPDHCQSFILQKVYLSDSNCGCVYISFSETHLPETHKWWPKMTHCIEPARTKNPGPAWPFPFNSLTLHLFQHCEHAHDSFCCDVLVASLYHSDTGKQHDAVTHGWTCSQLWWIKWLRDCRMTFQFISLLFHIVTQSAGLSINRCELTL